MSEWRHWRFCNREGMVTDVAVEGDEDFSDRGWVLVSTSHSADTR